jgi:hypothetical protein
MLMDLLNNVENENEVEKELDIIHRFVITYESSWKSYFDLVMLYASVYNSFIQAYYSAFGEPK